MIVFAFSISYFLLQVLFSVVSDLISLGLYLFDVGSDILTGVVYIIEGDTWWGGLTLAFTAVALVVTNLLSFRLVTNDDNFDINERWKLVFIILCILQLGMLFL